MNAHVLPPADFVRFPPRLRVVPLASSALDALLSAGTIDARQHAAGVAYAALRFRHDTAKHGADGLSPERWAAVKRDHAALLAAARFDRFLLDRLCLDGEAPLRCEVAYSGCSNRTHSAMVCGAVFRAMEACRLQPYSVIGCWVTVTFPSGITLTRYHPSRLSGAAITGEVTIKSMASTARRIGGSA